MLYQCHCKTKNISLFGFFSQLQCFHTNSQLQRTIATHQCDVVKKAVNVLFVCFGIHASCTSREACTPETPALWASQRCIPCKTRIPPTCLFVIALSLCEMITSYFLCDCFAVSPFVSVQHKRGWTTREWLHYHCQAGAQGTPLSGAAR